MQKTILSFLALFMLGIITFTSVGRQTTQNGVVTVTLSGWSNLNEKQLLQQVLKDFEAKHPHIKIKYDAIADQYMDVLKIRLIGDTAADVFYLDALEAPALMIPGVLEPLDNYITPEFDIADFEPSLLNAFQQDGKTYGLPKDFPPWHCSTTNKTFKPLDYLSLPKLGQNCVNTPKN